MHIPRRAPLVVPLTVVTILCLQSFAWSLTAEINSPPRDRITLVVGVSMKFEAAALDAAGGKTIEGAKWTWDFGDGTTSASNPAAHAYDEPGVYEVTAAGNLAGSKATDSLTVNVLQQQPGPQFTLELDPPADTVADCWDMKLIGPGTNDVNYVEIEHTWHRCSGEDEWVEQPGCIGEWTLAESTPEYRLWTTYWMTWACHNFAADTYVEVYWVGYGMPPPDGHAQTNTVTATPDNTVIKADPAQGIIKYDPDSQDPTIDWTITHLDPTPEGVPVFDVQVQICGLSGSVLHDVTVEQSGEGSGEYEWDGTCNQMMPPGDQASKGLYTFKLAATHQPYPHYYCGDDDKSAVLEISDVSHSDFEWVEFPTRASLTLHYTLSTAAADCELEIYKRDLTQTSIYEPSGGLLPGTSGAHEVTVEFEVDPQVTGSYYFVIYATESEDDAGNNRDHQPKPALQEGTNDDVCPPASHWKGDDWLYGVEVERRLNEWFGSSYKGAIHYERPTKDELLGEVSWGRDALFLLMAHSDGGGGGQIWIDREGAGSASVFGKAPDDYNPQHDVALRNLDADCYANLLLVQWVGCQTAKTHSVRGNLCEETLRIGASGVLGFEGCPNYSFRSQCWEYRFYENAIAAGRPSLEDCATAAQEEVWDRCGHYYWGYDTWKIFPEAAKAKSLMPPRWFN